MQSIHCINSYAQQSFTGARTHGRCFICSCIWWRVFVLIEVCACRKCDSWGQKEIMATINSPSTTKTVLIDVGEKERKGDIKEEWNETRWEHEGWRYVEMQWWRYFSRRGVDDVGAEGSGRESTLRSININLGQLTHKAEYSTHHGELWASCSEGSASMAAPLRINYIYLWCPGVSYYCRFFFCVCFLWNSHAGTTAWCPHPTEHCNDVN